MLKNLIKKITPKFILSAYHYCLAILAALIYRFPSNEMIVIGVTGTTGKTTTCYLIAQLLELAGYKVGLTSTAIFKVADKEWLNKKKMTMLGRLQTHKLLRQMVSAGCQYVVIETSSEGMLQHRHIGVHYDILVFTNLAPEHLEAHGGFDNYKKIKLKLFKQLEKSSVKKIRGQEILQTIIVNLDTEYSAEFLNFKIKQKITFSTSAKLKDLAPQPVVATDIQTSVQGLKFKINNIQFSSPLLGEFNIYNNLAAIAVLRSLGKRLEEIAPLLSQTKPCPGRIELIDAGQPFTVIVDYAFEPKALTALFQTIQQFKKINSKIITLTGSTGGGRDKSRRPLNGRVTAENSDYVIVTNEDPYDENPLEIINQVATGARQKGKEEGKNLFKILDRRAAIAKALSLAQTDDIVLITGKGCEQAMVIKNNKLIPWDDREIVREELNKRH